jgi:hypothetical protein
MDPVGQKGPVKIGRYSMEIKWDKKGVDIVDIESNQTSCNKSKRRLTKLGLIFCAFNS